MSASRHPLLSFARVTLMAMAVEMLTFLFLNSYALRGLNGYPVRFLCFVYSGENNSGLGSMIAFFASTVLASTLSFLMNRRHTFAATNRLSHAVGAYLVFTVLMILLHTLLGPLLEEALAQHAGGASAALAKGVMMALNFAVSYPVNQYVIMRAGTAEHPPAA